ncbi:MAG: 3'-5' exonuclease, partial [Bacillota bacterium]|nr:3'-5' exonuclease [Bacillota bacterium]
LHDLPKDLIVKMFHTYRKVNWLRGYSHYLPPAEFIWKLYDFNNFFDKIGNLPDGTERQDMLKTFVENVRNEGTGLEEVLQKEEMKLPNNLSEERDAVKLMTTHSSKGMGFPHVFLCNLDGYINDQDARGRVIKTDFGVAVSYLVDAEGRLCENEVYELA